MGIAQWPSLAVGYRLSGDGAADPSIALTLTLQLDAYTVSPELSVERALRNVETDRATFARAGAQLAEPGVGFALSTTLEHSVGGTPVSHPLDIEPFRSFVTSALAFLDALCATPPADFDVSMGTAPIPVAAKFAGPIVPLRVTVTQTRDPAEIDRGDNRIPDLAPSAVDATPQGALQSLFALDAFARSVETALPGVHVATDELGGGDDDALGRRLWLVNAASPRGPVMKFAFEPASEVRSFAIPPLSTSLESGSVMVTPYVTGSGLSGAPEPRVFAAIDLDTWAFTFLEAMDLVPAPDDAVDTITGAKRALATAIASRVQHVLAHDTAGESGSSARRRDAAIAAVQRSLHLALANAYAIQCVVQPAVVVTMPDAHDVQRLSGRPVLTQPDIGVPVLDASFLPGRVRLSKAAHGAPALASFPLQVHGAENARSATVSIGYEIVEIEHASRWLTLVHPLDPVTLAGVTLPIPLRTYPQPPSLGTPHATPSFATPVGTGQLVRWDARATWVQHAADQDEIALQFELGTANHDVPSRMHHRSSTGALLAALAQFITVWPEVRDDPATLTSRAPLSALRTMATAVAQVWPTDVIESATAAQAAPGSYGYTLTWPHDDSPNHSTVTVVAAAENPLLPWPELAVDAGDGMRALTLQSSTTAQAIYAYPDGIPKRTPLTYQVTVGQLDVMTVTSFALRAAVVRNANLIDGSPTSPSFVYRTPYAGSPAPVIPLLRIDANFDIGSGTVHQLEEKLRAFLSGLLERESAPRGSQRALHVAVSYGEDLLPTIPVALVPSVLLTISGDDGASIDAFARALAEAVVAWDAQAQASHANAAVFFDVSVFPVDARTGDEPLLVARSVRYALR